jgi:peptidoglycan/xylan/chitin deacetylase (PgdA/CDA1 family)
MRSQLKRTIEILLVRGGPAWIARRLGSSRDLILAYHNIVPNDYPEEGDRSLHLPRARFAEQLDQLAGCYEVVPLESMLTSRERRQARVAITFDDAYLGAVTIGVDELANRGLSATIFVVPGLLGGRSFWWDALADAAPGGLPADLRRTALGELRGRDESVREWAARLGRTEQRVGEYSRSATLEDLERAAGYSGISLASHSWSHPNLASLPPDELGDELDLPLRWLRQRFSSVIDWLSYPYGLASPVVEEAAATAGYRAALRINGGRMPARPASLYALPRINVPSRLTAEGLALRAAGLC